MESTKSFGVGIMQPADAREWAKFTLTVNEFYVKDAAYECFENTVLKNCAETLKNMILEKDVRDLFQMNNNVIYYNIEPSLKRNELYYASVCVLAAKRAAADWCRKNEVEFEESSCNCV
ncbi:MAG: hypothetical protein J1E34_04560 [Oscillospiraceae bacterium]|nr:hypothetical protein [Oscillospiraceae bacterium]